MPPSSFSLPFSEGVVCECALLPRPNGTGATVEPGLGAKGTVSGVWAAAAAAAAPGGGKLGGGMDVGSMVGRARAGEAEGPAAGPPGWNVGACMAREGGVAATAGVWSSMGAKRALDAEASLRRCESDLRGGMVCQLGDSVLVISGIVLLCLFVSCMVERRAGLVGTISPLVTELKRFLRKNAVIGCEVADSKMWFWSTEAIEE